ncbi:MAG TPA: hypothetical protein VLK58_09390 [Conexibacter sp.]|nr:hypothetical protein [Conexibacter sp.]
MSLLSLVSEPRRRVRDNARGERLSALARRLRAQIYTTGPLLVLVKPLDEIAVPVRHGQVRIEPLQRRHLPALAELNRERGDVEGDARFEADVAAGYGGMVGFVGDALACCYWWCDGTMPRHRDMRLLGLGIELGEGDVYGFDLYVDKRHRAGGTANDFLYQVESGLRERGFARLYGYVVADNRMARWTYDARGYRAAWRVERTRILRRWRNRIATIEGDGQVPA